MKGNKRSPAVRQHQPGRGLRRVWECGNLTACAACGQLCRFRLCEDCRAWLRVHAAHIAMSKAFKGMYGG